MTRNSLAQERKKAKSLGFTMRGTKNPLMRLAGGKSFVWMTGELISIVTTKTFFDNLCNLTCWKSSNRNDPYAAMTSTLIDSDGISKRTGIYVRESRRADIKALAAYYKVSEKNIVVDHINHKRGCNYDENLRLATVHQNNQNRSKKKVEKAFYTVDEVILMLKQGEFTPADDTVKLMYQK